MIASYHNDGFRRLYQRMLDGRQGGRGIKTKARVKLAAKMLVIAWTLLKNNEPFDETHLLAQSCEVRYDFSILGGTIPGFSFELENLDKE